MANLVVTLSISKQDLDYKIPNKPAGNTMPACCVNYFCFIPTWYVYDLIKSRVCGFSGRYCHLLRKILVGEIFVISITVSHIERNHKMSCRENVTTEIFGPLDDSTCLGKETTSCL